MQKNTQNIYRLGLQTPRLSWFLKADSAEDMARWNSAEAVEMIRHAVKAAGDDTIDESGKGLFKLSLEVPYGCYEIAANSMTKLIALVSPKTTRIMASLLRAESEDVLKVALEHLLDVHAATEQPGYDLEILAKAALVEYRENERQQSNHYIQTAIAKAGLELDVIKCYIQGMYGREIIAWLKTERDFTVSMSAVGRFTAKLRTLRIYPIRKQSATNGRK